jgi:hypothetical protein
MLNNTSHSPLISFTLQTKAWWNHSQVLLCLFIILPVASYTLYIILIVMSNDARPLPLPYNNNCPCRCEAHTARHHLFFLGGPRFKSWSRLYARCRTPSWRTFVPHAIILNTKSTHPTTGNFCGKMNAHDKILPCETQNLPGFWRLFVF